MEGIAEIRETIRKIRRSGINPALTVDGILVTMMNERAKYTRREQEGIVETLGKRERIFQAYIPYTVKLKECGRMGSSIFRYKPRGKTVIRAQEEYIKLAKEVINKMCIRDRVILTEWNQFRKLNLKQIYEAMNEHYFFDLRNIYRRKDVEAAGFQYFGVGR